MTKDDWSALLTSAHNDKLGTESSAMFDVIQATLWIAEGLMPHIPEAAIGPFVSCVNALSAKKSAFVFDGWRNRDQLANFPSESFINFIVSWGDDTLNSLNKLDWQIYHTPNQTEVNQPFYTLLKQ